MEVNIKVRFSGLERRLVVYGNARNDDDDDAKGNRKHNITRHLNIGKNILP